jgi:Uri superfamily endonuclease
MSNVVKIKENNNNTYKVNNNYIVTLVPHHYMGTIWNDVEKYLQKAVKRSKGRWTIDYLKNAIKKAEQELWVIFTEEDNEIIGAATTEFVYYPNSKKVAVQYLGGS